MSLAGLWGMKQLVYLVYGERELLRICYINITFYVIFPWFISSLFCTDMCVIFPCIRDGEAEVADSEVGAETSGITFEPCSQNREEHGKWPQRHISSSKAVPPKPPQTEPSTEPKDSGTLWPCPLGTGIPLLWHCTQYKGPFKRSSAHSQCLSSQASRSWLLAPPPPSFLFPFLPYPPNTLFLNKLYTQALHAWRILFPGRHGTHQGLFCSLS